MNGCGKQAFASRAEARDAARYMAKAPSDGVGVGGRGRRMHTYACPACGLWHLTSHSPTEQRRIARRMGQR